MDRVPFDSNGVKDCMCMQCPVQEKSQCAKRKEKSAGIEPEETPRLYCSSGKASCNDIDTKKMCICGSCMVWYKHNLSKSKPTLYYCRDGKAR